MPMDPQNSTWRHIMPSVPVQPIILLRGNTAAGMVKWHAMVVLTLCTSVEMCDYDLKPATEVCVAFLCVTHFQNTAANIL